MLLKLDPVDLMAQRVMKFRKMGAVEERVDVDPHIKRNMKKRDAPLDNEDSRLLSSGNGQANFELKAENSTPVNASTRD